MRNNLEIKKYKISIDKLSRKCKKFCLKNNFQLESAININGGYCNIYFVDSPFISVHYEDSIATEQKAVIRATKWVIKYLKEAI